MVHQASLVGQAVSILRQELDSMVRVIFLTNTNNPEFRDTLIQQTHNGERWRELDGRGIITDRVMVDLADQLNGWTASVYKFGCAFIHLSNYHDYQHTDPFAQLSHEERNDIKHHLNHYHGFPMDREVTMESVSMYLPMVFDKIHDNLERNIKELEELADQA